MPMDETKRQAQATMLQNRLRKNARHRLRQAAHQGIEAVRLYDRDIPELPLAIDWYAGRLYVAGFQREDEQQSDPDFVAQMASAAAELLQVPQDQVFLRHRQRQKGANQYTAQSQRDPRSRFTVLESGLKFWVDLSTYLDTGLFLHHRITRSLVEAEAAGRDFLNLFAYTGSFTVYAIRGGARTTTTVDLSRTYLNWALDNVKLNGLQGPAHRFLQGDARAFAEDAATRTPCYDLVVVDPPTFSNSKRMEGTFDVIRDHVPLLQDILKATRPGGVVYFSNNSKHFRLSPEAVLGCQVEDITDKTTPPDFQSRRPHRCWRIVKPK